MSRVVTEPTAPRWETEQAGVATLFNLTREQFEEEAK